MEGTVLIHHGIKGQKWGVRRYQNEDGTLTEAGKRRYYVNSKGEITELPSGRSLKKEHAAAAKKFESTDQYKALADKMATAEKKAIEIGTKYELDMDDGGGGNREKYSEKELSEAAKKYLDAWDEYDSAEWGIIENRGKYATKVITEKYGEQAIAKIKNYEKNMAAGIVAGMFAIPMAALVIDQVSSK